MIIASSLQILTFDRLNGDEFHYKISCTALYWQQGIREDKTFKKFLVF